MSVARQVTVWSICSTALLVLLLYYLSPIRVAIPWKVTVLFEPGFEGPVRIVTDVHCPAAYQRSGLTYTVRLPPSGQLAIDEPIMDKAYSRGQYAGMSSELPSIGANSRSAPGFSFVNVKVIDGRFIYLGFVGTIAQFEEFGMAGAIERHFESIPPPPCLPSTAQLQ
jgi:hypothetical protein